MVLVFAIESTEKRLSEREIWLVDRQSEYI